MELLALVGNPNCGKTTLFNRLTGQNQHVGNWAGVTAERKEGFLRDTQRKVQLVDLPGVYSLSPYTLEERITRDFLEDGACPAVINLLDATSLERGLYLTMQLCELGCPMVIALGMMDEVRAKGKKVDSASLEKILGVAVVPISAKMGEGVRALIENAMEQARPATPPRYGTLLELAISETVCVIAGLVRRDRLRYTAIALLESEQESHSKLQLATWQIRQIADIRRRMERCAGEDVQTLFAGARYRAIELLLRQTVSQGKKRAERTVSDQIDRVVLHRFWAIPVFAAMMSGMFFLCFGGIGRAVKQAAEYCFEWMSCVMPGWLTIHGISPPIVALICEGILGGVGNVLTFLPQIALIFLCLTLLEECGYLSRAAFIMDLPLRKLGLTGKAFIPMLMGFGCTTSAIMAARTLENERDRRLTIYLTPYFSCSARLPIYALFAGTFFPAFQGLVTAMLYLLGVAAAIFVAWLLKKGPFRGPGSPFLMEFPPYRMPSPRNVLRNTGERCVDFLQKAGTLIFLLSLVIWLLRHFNFQFCYTNEVSDSMFAAVGGAFAPLFRPLGFGNRESAVAILAGLISKEAVVSVLGVSIAAEGAGLSGALIGWFSPLSAAAFLTFCALYAPCVSALATMRRELRSTARMLVAAAGQTLLAYCAALAVFQVGTLWQNLFG